MKTLSPEVYGGTDDRSLRHHMVKCVDLQTISTTQVRCFQFRLVLRIKELNIIRNWSLRLSSR